MAALTGHCRQLKADLANVRRTLALAAALPGFFRDRISLQQAEEGLKRLLDTRVDRFLGVARTQIYASPGSPYLRMLKHAGCEFSDLEAGVNRHGLEETLARLAGEGVYLTSDEFKGKTEVVRGAMSFLVSAKDVGPRSPSVGFTMQSSGTRTQPTSTFQPLEWQTLRAMTEAVFYTAHGFSSGIHAVCEPVIAGRVNRVLLHAKLGIPTDRWFALRVGVHSVVEDSYHKLNARLVARMGSWFGPGIANPEYIHMEDVTPILQWIEEKRRDGMDCRITAVVSTAARIARTAIKMGVSLSGTRFHVSGEPLTRSKRQLIEDAGAYVTLHYGPGDGTGGLLGCGNPSFIDEVHLPRSVFTLTEHPRPLDYGGLSIHPLMFTTLHPSAPRLLFNVENGDYATMMARDCGCPLQAVGFTQHIHTIRSFEKMTGEGMNYSGTDLFDLLESTIPVEFGGGPGDYQLVEEEDDRGQTRLTLVVHPDVGELDDEKLLSRLKQGLAQGSRNQRFMAGMWEGAGTLRIKRGVPYASPRGKTLPLHIKQKD